MPEWSERRRVTEARRLWHRRRGSVDGLLASRSPLTFRHREDERFLEALQEAAAYHYLRDPEFRARCPIHPCRLERLDDALQLPPSPLAWELGPLDRRRLDRLGQALASQSRSEDWREEFKAAIGVALPVCPRGEVHLPRALRLHSGHWVLPYPKSSPRLLVPAPGWSSVPCPCELSSPRLQFTKT